MSDKAVCRTALATPGLLITTVTKGSAGNKGDLPQARAWRELQGSAPGFSQEDSRRAADQQEGVWQVAGGGGADGGP